MTGLLILILAGIRQRKRGRLYVLGLSLFGLYVLMVIAQVFFPMPLAENWPANLTWEHTVRGLTRINLVPLKYGSTFAFSINPRALFREVAGNILVTIPFGFGMCFLTPLRGKRLLWLALTVGLAMEGTQLLLILVLGYSYRSVDINDVILNALGVLVGYGLYQAVKWRRRWPS